MRLAVIAGSNTARSGAATIAQVADDALICFLTISASVFNASATRLASTSSRSVADTSDGNTSIARVITRR
jgi:hypothetical protein